MGTGAVSAGGSVETGFRRGGIEWPTLLVAVAIHGGWAAILIVWQAIGLWAAIALLAVLIAWHGSLQHEVLHGHPTRLRGVNDAIGSVPLALWLPYQRYRTLHLRHHRDPLLTDPVEDPESQYLTGTRWAALPPVLRFLFRANRTFLGRMLLGPALAWSGFWKEEAVGLARGDRERRLAWALHLPGVAAVLLWVVACGMPLWAYIVACYLGTALSMVRSFAEHRAGPEGLRTAVVESGPFFSLLFLNNNLHVAHHARPGLAWYRLPRYARAIGASRIAAAGAGLWDGYGALAWRHLLRPFDRIVHPDYPIPAQPPVREGEAGQGAPPAVPRVTGQPVSETGG